MALWCDCCGLRTPVSQTCQLVLCASLSLRAHFAPRSSACFPEQDDDDDDFEKNDRATAKRLVAECVTPVVAVTWFCRRRFWVLSCHATNAATFSSPSPPFRRVFRNTIPSFPLFIPRYRYHFPIPIPIPFPIPAALGLGPLARSLQVPGRSLPRCTRGQRGDAQGLLSHRRAQEDAHHPRQVGRRRRALPAAHCRVVGLRACGALWFCCLGGWVGGGVGVGGVC
jgi:hypothetical protein